MPSQPLTTEDLAILEKYLESKITALQETMRAAYPARTELLELLDRINHRITQLEISKAQLEGKADRTQVIIFGAIAITSFVIAVVDFISHSGLP